VGDVAVAHGHHHGHDAGEKLYIHRHTAIHRLPSHLKILSLFTFLVIVVATPIERYQAFMAYGLMIISLLMIAQLPVFTILKRATVEIPFLLFAFLMPFVAGGEKIEFLGVALSKEGALSAASIITKGTIGVLTAILLSGSTPSREVIRGFKLLRMPSLLVQIMSFMLRYVHVVTAELERMRISRMSRGFMERGIRDWKFIANTAGVLFIRSYERGERVHTSMIARGYRGELPDTISAPLRTLDKAIAIAIPAVALSILTLSGVLR